MYNTLIADWFGDEFYKLHPLLQQLHTSGGVLEGKVDLQIGHTGLSRILGKMLAKKLGIPVNSGEHLLTVHINNDGGVLNWRKTFNHAQTITSIFKPVGIKENGFFLEESGPFKMRVTADLVKGAWYWKLEKIYFKKLKLPNWFFYQSMAKKYINDKNEYVFVVKFSCIGLGEILSYRGILKKVENENFI